MLWYLVPHTLSMECIPIRSLDIYVGRYFFVLWVQNSDANGPTIASTIDAKMAPSELWTSKYWENVPQVKAAINIQDLVTARPQSEAEEYEQCRPRWKWFLKSEKLSTCWEKGYIFSLVFICHVYLKKFLFRLMNFQ